jgi:hypothetical protein
MTRTYTGGEVPAVGDIIHRTAGIDWSDMKKGQIHIVTVYDTDDETVEVQESSSRWNPTYFNLVSRGVTAKFEEAKKKFAELVEANYFLTIDDDFCDGFNRGLEKIAEDIFGVKIDIVKKLEIKDAT